MSFADSGPDLSNPRPPGHRFGPTFIHCPDMQGYLIDSANRRATAREEIGSMWWPVAARATETMKWQFLFKAVNGRNFPVHAPAQVDAFLDQMLVLREHIEAVTAGNASPADIEAVAASGDVWPKSTRPYPAWLGGAVLDQVGFSTVGLLARPGMTRLWEHLAAEKQAAFDAEAPQDPAVHLLGCWLQDSIIAWRDRVPGFLIQYMADAPPVLQEDRDTNRQDRPAITEIINQAFGLLVTWGLHCQRHPDGTGRTIDQITGDPALAGLFRAADQNVWIDSRREDNRLSGQGPPKPRP